MAKAKIKLISSFVTMNERTINSNKTALFSGGQLLLIYLIIVVISAVLFENKYIGISLLFWVTLFIKKKKVIDIDARTFKDGPLAKRKLLPENGYISIVRKINKSTKKVDMEGLMLMYVAKETPIHIYSADTYEDLKETALLLAENWKCGVYEVHSKTWLMDK